MTPKPKQSEAEHPVNFESPHLFPRFQQCQHSLHWILKTNAPPPQSLRTPAALCGWFRYEWCMIRPSRGHENWIKSSHVANVPVTHLFFHYLSCFSLQRLENRATRLLCLRFFTMVTKALVPGLLEVDLQSVLVMTDFTVTLPGTRKTMQNHTAIPHNRNASTWDHLRSLVECWLPSNAELLTMQLNSSTLQTNSWNLSIRTISFNHLDKWLYELSGCSNLRWPSRSESSLKHDTLCKDHASLVLIGIGTLPSQTDSNGSFEWAVDTKACREQKQMELRGVDLCKTNCLETTKIVCFIPIRPLPLKLYQ